MCFSTDEYYKETEPTTLAKCGSDFLFEQYIILKEPIILL